MNEAHEQTITYFGYGSLVNLETLQTPYISAHPGVLNGWKRVWLSRPKLAGSFAPYAGLAFLSVKPSEGTCIEGMLVEDDVSSLPALDEREALYDRVKLDADTIELTGGAAKISAQSYLYVAQSNSAPPDEPPKILRSYLDVVFKGYLDCFGESALARFVDTTDNFELPVLEDRQSPTYPRSVVCTQAELALFESIVPLGGLEAI